MDGASTDTASLLCRASPVCDWKQEKASAFPLILPPSRPLALHNYLCAARGKSKIIKASQQQRDRCAAGAGLCRAIPACSPLPQAPMSPASVPRCLRSHRSIKPHWGWSESVPRTASIPRHRREESVMGWDEPGWQILQQLEINSFHKAD